MARRDKTKLEKFFSLSRHKRRVNAKNLSLNISKDFKLQKETRLDGLDKKYTYGSSNDLEEHFNSLKSEFSGESELVYTHAKIIVLIRREFEEKKYFEIFEQLWSEEKDFLLKNLNTRWLISAADTFIDHSKDFGVQSLSLACLCLFNTVKMYETERYIIQTKTLNDDPKKVKHLQNERVPLFDGTSAFAVGTDDTLRNMRWRIDKVAKHNVAGEILLEIFKRLQQNETVYKRFKDRHTRKRTGWW